MDRAEQIIQLVSNNPGIRYSEIMRETGLANGVLSHHLSKIEQSGKIIVERTPRVARAYPCGTPEQETTAIKHLRSSTSRKILTVLLEENLSFKDIVSKVRKSQGTVSLSLKGLCEDGVVERLFVSGSLMFQITNKPLLDRLIEKQPTFIENTANNISDVFSAL